MARAVSSDSMLQLYLACCMACDLFLASQSPCHVTPGCTPLPLPKATEQSAETISLQRRQSKAQQILGCSGARCSMPLVFFFSRYGFSA